MVAYVRNAVQGTHAMTAVRLLEKLAKEGHLQCRMTGGGVQKEYRAVPSR